MSTIPIIEAFWMAIQPYSVMWMVLGVVIGALLGATPGIGPVVGITVLLPLTVPMTPLHAMIFLIGIYLGASYGASISAILINTPGTAVAAATAIDGYPMTQKGKAANALAISAVASAIGGVISITLLLFIIPFLSAIVLAFGSFEYLLIALLGIAIIGVIDSGSIIKGYTAGAFGVLISTIGIAPMVNEFRYTLDTVILLDGFHFIPILIGMFAFAEMIKLSAREGSISDTSSSISGSISAGIKETVKMPKLTAKSSLIGMGIGAVPGAGASISNFVAYAEAKRSCKNTQQFGQGDSRGVTASESSNSATAAGALIPTLSFGIPGSGTTAILLGALLLHGLQPGPTLLTDEISLTYAFLISMLLGNIVIIIFGLGIIRHAHFITEVDTNKLIPMILVLAMIGTLTLRNNWLDLFAVFIFGFLAYKLLQYDYSIIALVLGVILGPIIEHNLVRTGQFWDGYSTIIARPISIILIIAIILTFMYPFYTNRIDESGLEVT